MDLRDLDACTLPTAQRPLRAAEFDDLFATHVVAVETTSATAAVLWFAGDEDPAERVRDLSVRETMCCSFFKFAVSEEGGRVRLGIEVPLAYSAVLGALVGRAKALA
jgi:hypothetical protein